jgi:hypothetical protein
MNQLSFGEGRIFIAFGQAAMLEPAMPILRYEYEAPSDALHIDIKKLTRIVRAGHRITGDPRDETRDADREFSTSPSTTTRTWFTPPCIRTKRPYRPSSPQPHAASKSR